MRVRRRRNSNLDSNTSTSLGSLHSGNFGAKDSLQNYKSGQGDTEECLKLLWCHIPVQSCWLVVVRAVGLLLAGLIGLFHAWCVYSIHENLLWFSHLKVSSTRTFNFVTGNVAWKHCWIDLYFLYRDYVMSGSDFIALQYFFFKLVLTCFY